MIQNKNPTVESDDDHRQRSTGTISRMTMMTTATVIGIMVCVCLIQARTVRNNRNTDPAEYEALFSTQLFKLEKKY